MLKPDIYIAVITNGSVGKSRNGTPQIAIEFRPDGSTETIWYYCFLTDKTKDRTLETLAMLNWSGDCDEVSGRWTDGSWDPNKRVQIVVEDETNPINGKTFPRVKWVNSLEKTTNLQPMEIKTMVATLKGELAILRKGSQEHKLPF